MQGWRQNYELANAYHGNGNSPVYLLEDRWHRADLYDPDSEWIPGRYPAIRKGEFKSMPFHCKPILPPNDMIGAQPSG